MSPPLTRRGAQRPQVDRSDRSAPHMPLYSKEPEAAAASPEAGGLLVFPSLACLERHQPVVRRTLVFGTDGKGRCEPRQRPMAF